MHIKSTIPGPVVLVTAAIAVLALAACSEGNLAGGDGDGDGGTGGGGHDGGGGGGQGADGGSGGGVPCVDACPAPQGGIEIACKTRFMYGINYAWHKFAADFGGVIQWDVGGVAAEASAHAMKLADMRAHGANVVRWWVFPEFRGEGVLFDADDNPTGLGSTTLGDLEKALELADKADVNLMLCLFSFDNFRPTRVDSELRIPGITPMVTDAQKRSSLMTNVVRPLARAVEGSRYKHRLVAWDVINEPEWAITGESPYGDPDYEPMLELDPVTHAQMETFVTDTIQALRAESHALVTVGGAALKWSKAWSTTPVDFYTFHIYDWVNTYWPYNQSPADYGVDDKPVVMGEFPIGGLATAGLPQMLDSWYGGGYAGALSWAYDGATPEQLDAMKSFADTKPCETRY